MAGSNDENAGAVPRCISVGEAGIILGISRPTAYRAARDGHIPTIEVGKRRMVPLPALEKLLRGEA